MELEGKVAIVTGAALGIGSAIALDLAKNGADVAIVDLKYEQARAVCNRIVAAGRRGLALGANVAIAADVQQGVDAIVKEFGRVDILVNNAGINRDAVIWKMTEAQWDDVLAVDLKGTFNFIRAVAPRFKDQASGKIVNIASINGLRGKFGQANYSAAKAGVIGLTKAVARELAKYNVNCNAVAPGAIETEMIKQMPEDARQKSLEEILLGRFGTPEDIAWVISFLCSDKARHITGQVIQVDGGQYI